MSLTNVIPPTPEEGCQGQARIAGGLVYLFTCFECHVLLQFFCFGSAFEVCSVKLCLYSRQT